ncbi:MAG: hypothetical protein ACREMY_02620, partial [bacterium]
MRYSTQLGLVTLAVALGFALEQAPTLVVAGVLVSAGCLAMLSLPRHWLPAIALAIFALIPVSWLPIDRRWTTLSPALFVVLIWALRVGFGKELRAARSMARAKVSLPAVLGAWIIVNLLRHVNSISLDWSVSFIVLALGPIALIRYEPRAARVIMLTWIYVSGALGTYAVIEAFIIRSNPIFDWAYRSGFAPLIQHWSVYRATTT